jgi:hypothetical protein
LTQIAPPNPYITVKEMYLTRIANPEAPSVDLALGEFLHYCHKYNLNLSEIEDKLDYNILINHLIAWCKCQSDARYMVVAQQIKDMVGSDSVGENFLMVAIEMADNLSNCLDTIYD